MGDTVYVGIAAAAKAAGIPRSRIARMIDRGFLKPVGKGGTSDRGGRPAFLIARKDLDAAIAAREKWLKPAEKQPPPRGRPRQASRRQKRKSAKRLYDERRKIYRHFLNSGARRIKHRGQLRGA